MSKYIVILAKTDFICRVCLASGSTDRLHSIQKDRLGDLYEELISTPVSQRDGMPQHICSYCKSLLLKAVSFKRKCQATLSYLQNIMVNGSVTSALIPNKDKLRFKLPYSVSPVTKIELSNTDVDVTETDVKEELKIDNYVKDFNSDNNADDTKIFSVIGFDLEPINVNNDDDIDNHDINDDLCDELSVVNDTNVEEAVKVESLLDNDDNFIINDTCTVVIERNDELIQKYNEKTSIKQRASNKRKNANINKTNTAKKAKMKKLNEEISERISTMLEKSRDPIRQTFFDYIMKKYEQKTDKFNNDEIKSIVLDEDVSEDGLKYDLNEDLDAKKYISGDVNVPVPRQMFYAYIRDIYVLKKDKFKFKKPKNFLNFEVMDLNCKRKLDSFAKEYNFTVKTFTFEEQKKHLEKLGENFSECQYKCEDCLRGFNLENALKNHQRLCHDLSLGPERCNVCGRRFPNTRRLYLHLLVHKYQLQCNECGQICRETSLAKTHNETHKGQEFPCGFCDKVFSKYKSRLNHVSVYHAGQTCDICYKKLTTNTLSLALHRKLKHGEIFPCDVCKTVFNTEEARNTHVNERPDNTACSEFVPCAACGVNLATEDERKSHIDTHHANVGMKRTPCCPCRCKGNTKVLREDKRRGKKRRCGCYCTVSEIEKECKDNNKTPKGVRKRFMCEVCAQCNFMSLASLREHQRVHTGERPFACSHCPKRFRTKFGLQNHQPSHTGERNYPCRFCEKKFLSPSGIHRHERSVHLKLRPNRCEMCDKMYSSSTDLKIHIRTAHFNLPWPKRKRDRRSRAHGKECT